MIVINYSKEGDKYIATIQDGWWSATGKTKEDAIKRVIKRYEKELGIKENDE